MIEIKTHITGEVFSGLDKLDYAARGEIVLSGVAAMARVIYEEAKRYASGTMKTGLPGGPPGRVTGNLARSIYRVYAKDQSIDGRQYYYVSWNKKTAPHGHLLEFGTSRAPAYPFLRPAFSRIKEAIAAGEFRIQERLREFKP